MRADGEPLEVWLRDHPLPRRSLAFGDAAVATLVGTGTLLLTGSLMLALQLVEAPELAVKLTSSIVGVLMCSPVPPPAP